MRGLWSQRLRQGRRGAGPFLYAWRHILLPLSQTPIISNQNCLSSVPHWYRLNFKSLNISAWSMCFNLVACCYKDITYIYSHLYSFFRANLCLQWAPALLQPDLGSKNVITNDLSSSELERPRVLIYTSLHISMCIIEHVLINPTSFPAASGVTPWSKFARGRNMPSGIERRVLKVGLLSRVIP